MTLRDLADDLGMEPRTLVSKARKAGHPVRADENGILTNEQQAFLRHIATIPKDQLKGFARGIKAPFKPLGSDAVALHELIPSHAALQPATLTDRLQASPSLTGGNSEQKLEHHNIDLLNTIAELREEVDALKAKIDAQEERLILTIRKRVATDTPAAIDKLQLEINKLKTNMDDQEERLILTVLNRLGTEPEQATVSREWWAGVSRLALDLEAARRDAKEYHERTQTVIETLRRRFEVVDVKVADLHPQVQIAAQTEEAIAHLRTFLDSANTALSDHGQRLNALESSIQSLLATKSAVESLELSLAESLASLRQQMQASKNELATLKEASMAHLGEYLDTAETALSDHDRRLNALESSIGALPAIRSDVDTLELSLAELLASLQRQMQAQQSEVATLKEQIHRLIDQQTQDQQILLRLRDAKQKSSKAKYERLHLLVERPVEALEERGLFFDPSLINRCIRALEVGDPLLLVGPPGVGKTTLAQMLPELFNQTGDLELKTITPDSAWQSFDVLGGKWIAGDAIVPHLGFFAESILNAIEREGKYWLFIDEINRCDVERSFSGLFTALAQLQSGQASIEIPAFGTLPIPSTFRLICAMNDTESRHVFPLSEEFMNRFSVVRLPKPDFKTERKLIDFVLANEVIDGDSSGSVFNLFGRGKRHEQQRRFDRALTSFLTEVERIREVCTKRNAEEYSPSIRDTRRVLHAMRAEDLSDSDAWLDGILVRMIVPSLARAERSIAEEVLDRWKSEARFPQARARLEVHTTASELRR